MIGSPVTTVTNISGDQNRWGIDTKYIPSYSNWSDKVGQDTTIFITAPFSEKKRYTQVFEIIRWLKQNRYYAEIHFKSTDEKINFHISVKDMKEIKKVEDIKNYEET